MSIKDITSFKWINEPAKWNLTDGNLCVNTDGKTDFWQSTWYGFKRHSGHFYGCDMSEDFTFQVCIQADFTTLYDQAGIMVLVDENQWLKAGIEYNDGQPMIGSVLTNESSDWATGIFLGDPKRFWMRITKLKNALRVQYSSDGKTWPLLRLCPFMCDSLKVGIMCCTPERADLRVQFSNILLSKPLDKGLHDLS